MVATTIQQGAIVSGFEILAVEPLEELQAIGIWARHQTTMAEVFHILNDDEENLFAFAFATIPTDSSGVAHILEHSVLCGSRKYPLKDTFIVLAQGSLQTFLNAMTFPDKTVYPASSTNRQDYFNLMSVYADAVFHPLLEEWIFMQEGHRLELVKDEESGSLRLERTGVVYNEMKGNYSSVDPIAADWAFRSVLPDTPYAFDSGGDPRDIPQLTWEDVRRFHRTHYNPANCKIMLCGNIPTEEQLDFLNTQVLSSLEGGEPIPPVSTAASWQEERRLSIPYPASTADQKSTVLLSWLVGDTMDPERGMALAALTEVLLGHDGSPLHKALVESHLGEDIAPATGLEGELRQFVFTIGLRGVDKNKAEAVKQLILDTLINLYEKGIPQKEIEAALFSLRFSNQEIRRSGGPFSLVWMRRSLRGWLHGAHPWKTLLFKGPFTALENQLHHNSRYLEELIRDVLIENPHRCLVTVDPVVGLSEQEEAREQATLAALLASMDEESKKNLEAKTALLHANQENADDEAALRSIPHIARTDLSPYLERVHRVLGSVQGVPVLYHDLYTNGIVYVDMALPVDVVKPEDYVWLPLLARVIPGLGIPGMSYDRLSSEMARQLGGFHGLLHTSSAAPGIGATVAMPGGTYDLRGRDWLVFRIKTLDEKINPALDLVLPLIQDADFSDLDRLRDLIVEYRNDLHASLAPSGHSYALSWAGRFFSRSRYIDDLWNGIPQIEFAHSLVDMSIKEVRDRLVDLRSRLFNANGFCISCTGSPMVMERAAEALVRGLDSKLRKGPGPRELVFSSNPVGLEVPGSDEQRSYFGGNDEDQQTRQSVFTSPSLQIGFAALALPAAAFASREQAAELVLSHWLSTKQLWEDIRMKGGAYGAFAYPDGLEPVFLMATYRDPDPRRSLEALPKALSAIAAPSGTTALPRGEELEKVIIGTYAKETRPRTSAEKGFADFLRFLTGIDDEMRKRKLQHIISMDEESLVAQASSLVSSLEQVAYTVVAGSSSAADCAAYLQVPVRNLPV
ncbi:MAG: insulinase family protein [Termitinemataceae bacterium]